MKSVKDLCAPSLIYLVISIISVLFVLFQNLGNMHSYHVGSFSCRVPNTPVVFIIKFIYILFWTWVLNLICKNGYPGISWFLILLPFILLFVMIGLVAINM